MADKIVVLRDGRIEQAGPPVELYDDPDNLFVAGFIGSPRMNMLAGRVAGFADGMAQVALDAFPEVTVPVALIEAPAVERVILGVRPEHFLQSGGARSLPITVDVIENLGGTSYAYATVAGKDEPLIVEWRGRERPAAGTRIEAGIDPELCLLFDPESERRLR